MSEISKIPIPLVSTNFSYLIDLLALNWLRQIEATNSNLRKGQGPVLFALDLCDHTVGQVLLHGQPDHEGAGASRKQDSHTPHESETDGLGSDQCWQTVAPRTTQKVPHNFSQFPCLMLLARCLFLIQFLFIVHLLE